MDTLATGVVLASLLGGFLVFAGHPLMTILRARGRPPDVWPDWDQPPPVTLLTVVRNGGALITDKLRNSLELDYPSRHLRILVCSDGSDDDTARRAAQFAERGVRLLAFPEHRGKNPVLNDAIAACDTDIVVFSDADARLAPDALRHLLAPLADPAVGGVCGQRRIDRDRAVLRDAQASYIRFDSGIKALESRAGSLTSNDGKLYAARRSLLGPLPESATDDLFNCLQVVAAGARFVFAPHALAFVRVPSRSARHELQRRRRIVARSLNGLARQRRLLDPRRDVGYAAALFINKILRRLLPLFQLGLLGGSAMLAPRQPLMAGLLGAQLLFYAAALLPGPPGRKIRYFNLGSLGTLLGLVDVLRGHRPARWDPRKGP